MNIIANLIILNSGTILVRGVNEDAVSRVINLVKSHGPRHALLRFKNVDALGRYDEEAERNNLSMEEMENLVADAIGCSAKKRSSYTLFQGRT